MIAEICSHRYWKSQTWDGTLGWGSCVYAITYSVGTKRKKSKQTSFVIPCHNIKYSSWGCSWRDIDGYSEGTSLVDIIFSCPNTFGRNLTSILKALSTLVSDVRWKRINIKHRTSNLRDPWCLINTNTQAIKLTISQCWLQRCHLNKTLYRDTENWRACLKLQYARHNRWGRAHYIVVNSDCFWCHDSIICPYFISCLGYSMCLEARAQFTVINLCHCFYQIKV